ncbi:MAG: hypothetical protein RQ885_01925 [Desulfurococcales archaeon]|jgi:hypothetical protein|nr:hypothetical protein [Desulfurococcales archaeon]
MMWLGGESSAHAMKPMGEGLVNTESNEPRPIGYLYAKGLYSSSELIVV